MAVIRKGEGASDFEKTLDVSADQLAILQEAAESCPTMAIQITKE